ncbi:MAG: hypothetical protein JRI51_10990 [Deltaproteobacteria bacterium]|nr:hypothetical protein [Deltaproteobacteria bacterium]
MLPGPLLEAMVELPQVVAPQARPEPQVQQRVLQEALMPVVLVSWFSVKWSFPVVK